MLPLKLRLSFRFWRTYAPASVVITFCCAFLVRQWGIEFIGTTILLKSITNGAIVFLVNEYQSQRLYYYHNHGLSKPALWMRTLGIDATVFLMAVIPATL